MIRDVLHGASRRQRIVAILLLVWLIYGALGYFALSPWLRSTLVSSLTEQTGREVVLEKAVFNPFALSLSLQQFSLKDQDGSDFFAFDQFYINFQLSSLLRRSWHFDRIALLAPRGRLVQQSDGGLNIDDLLATFSSDESTEPETPTRLPRVSFAELSIVDGDFRFRDEARSEPDELALTPLTFQVLDFSTRADGEGNNQFEFSVTGPDGGQLDWQGAVVFEPLRASGRIALTGVSLVPFADFFQHYLNFSVPEATLDIASEYQLEADGEGALQLTNGELVLSDLAIHDPLLAEPVISLSRLRLGDIDVDTARQKLVLGRVDVDGLVATVKWQQQGLQLAHLLTPNLPLVPADKPAVAEVPAVNASEENGDTVLSPEQENNAPDTPPWQLVLRQLMINAASFTVIDETLTSPAQLLLNPVNFSVNNIQLGNGIESDATTSKIPSAAETSSATTQAEQDKTDSQIFTFSGDMAIAERGTLTLSGEGELEPLAINADMVGSDIALPDFQAWLQDHAAVELRSGQLTTGLGLTVQTLADDSVNVEIAGDATVANLNLLESDGSPLLSWRRLAVNGLSLASVSQQVTVASIELEQPQLQSLVDAEGRDLAMRILPAAEPADAGVTPDTPWHIRIGNVRWQDGELLHRDRSLASSFQISLKGVRGELAELDSQRRDSGRLSLQAEINDVSPLSVTGTLNPLASTPNMALQISMQGYDMAGLTPYTGTYLGHAVASGQLQVTSEMMLDDTLLDSSSRIQADNFFLGDKVESEQALNAPIKLGLAVLRDRSGMISLPIKASGDLADPSVSVSGIILRAITNVMVKAAMSPFSALASLAGGKEINQIAFQPGQVEPTDQGNQQMADIAALLQERPSLILELSGAVTDDDRLQLARQLLGQELLEGGWPGLEVALSRADFRRAVQRRYQEQFAMSAETLLGDQVIADQTTRQRAISERAFVALAESFRATLADSRIQELADLRAQRGKALLVERFALAPERLSIVPSTTDAPVSGLSLGLGAR